MVKRKTGISNRRVECRLPQLLQIFPVSEMPAYVSGLVAMQRGSWRYVWPLGQPAVSPGGFRAIIEEIGQHAVRRQGSVSC
jgi:hypothetical protein